MTSIVSNVDGSATLLAFTDQGGVWEFSINESGTGNTYSPGDLQVPTVVSATSPTGREVSPTQLLANPFLDPIRDMNGAPLVFDHVTQGPRNFEDNVNGVTEISDLYFGVSGNRLYAFDLGARTTRPVFAYGADHVVLSGTQQGSDIGGLFFGLLDRALWHTTDDPLLNRDGMGDLTNFHGMGELEDRNEVGGGGSLRFGFDQLNQDFSHLDAGVFDNTLDAEDLQGISGYNFFGGAHGSVHSNSLDLSGFSAADLPTLYFSYLLDAENVNARTTLTDGNGNTTNFNDGGLDNVMRDSLRVYVTGDDGQWSMVASNNFADSIGNRVWDDFRDDPAVGADHEYEFAENNYTNVAEGRFLQELFNDQVFRQARIDLGPWAGDENVQIRFEFTTAGEARPDQSEIFARPGEEIQDATGFSLSGQMPDPASTNVGSALPNRTVRFEFDHGLVVQMPAGQHVVQSNASHVLTGPNGDILEILPAGMTRTTTAPVPVVQVTNADSASDVAAAVVAALGGTVQAPSDPERVAFTNETTPGGYTFGSSFGGFIQSTPGVSAGRVSIPISVTSTTEQVRDEIQLAIANEIRYFDGAMNRSSFPIVEQTNSIRIYDLNLTMTADLLTIEGDGASTNLPGSNFGVYSGTGFNELLRAGERTRGNGGALGVYIDDIVVGLAERGESVSNSNQTGTVANPYFEAELYKPLPIDNVEPVVEEVVAGAYQLEARLALEYLGDDNTGKDVLVSPNERLANSFDAEVLSDGSQIVDGDTFELSSGFETLTFEFTDETVPALATPITSGNIPVPYRITDTPGQIADSIRDALNLPSVQLVLGLQGTSSGGDLNDPTDPRIVFHGYAAASATGSSTFASPHLRGIVNGQDVVLGEDHGDRNRDRDQGQFIIDSNTISFSSDTAIRLSAGDTGPGNKVPNEGDRPKPGAVQNLRIANASPDMLHGGVIQNNLLIENTNGIVLDGNPAQGGPNIFSRVVNNTVFGSDRAITIQDQASPTLLNNALVDNNVGILASNQGPTVLRSTLFSGNNNDVTGVNRGTEAIVNPSLPLFVNTDTSNFDLYAGTPNFYPELGSALIDVGVDSQEDRNNLVAVKDTLDIPESPILVTQRDLAGQVRGDGGSQAGQGSNVNVDIGALDRSDRRGPEAIIVVPIDNDANNVDIDQSNTFLHLSDGIYEFFEVLLRDANGIGPDSSTVITENIQVFENGRELTRGRDITIGYNATTRRLRFQLPSGRMRNDAVYEINLINQSDGTPSSGIRDLAGNLLEANRVDGQTRFTIVMPGVELDFGDAPASFGTQYADDGARHAIINFGNPRLGQYVDGEPDSDLANNPDSDDIVPSVSAQGNVQEQGDGPFTITATASGVTIQVSAVPSSDPDALRSNLQVEAAGRTVIFELFEAAPGRQPSAGRVGVAYQVGTTDQETQEEIAALLLRAMQASFPAQNVQVQATASSTDATELVLTGVDDEDGAGIGSVEFASAGLTVPGLFIDPNATPDPTTGLFAESDIISFLNPESQEGALIPITTVGGGLLDGWVDFDGDGQFQTDERIWEGLSVPSGLSLVPIPKSVNGSLGIPDNPAVLSNPVNGSGFAWMRIRLSENGSLTHDSLVVGGEVEDYRVLVAAAETPEPADDTYGLADGLFEDNPLVNATTVGVNDADNSAQDLVFEIVDDVSNGTLTFRPDGTFDYAPHDDFFGTDTFTYRMTGTQQIDTDGDGTTDVDMPVRSSLIGTVSLIVESRNDVPIANDRPDDVTTEPSSTSVLAPLVYVTEPGVRVDPTDLASPFFPNLLEGANVRGPMASLDACDATADPIDCSPFDESDQRIWVSQIFVTDSNGNPAGVIPSIIPVGMTEFLGSTHLPSNGGFVQTGTVTVTIDPTDNNKVVRVVYQPEEDYNELNPAFPGATPADPDVPSTDSFRFEVTDNGTSGPVDNLQSAPETTQRTVTIRVTPQNDAPTANDDLFTSANHTDVILEDQDVTFTPAQLLANDFAGSSPDDDESTGASGDGTVTLVTELGSRDLFNVGPINQGVAVHSPGFFETFGTGYILFSEQNVFSRFVGSPPLSFSGNVNSQHMVAVRLNGADWEYSNGSDRWVQFFPVLSDRLIAEVDFDFGTINSLEYSFGTVGGPVGSGGINQGFAGTDLEFNGNQFGLSFSPGDFLITGTFFEVLNDPNFPTGFRQYPLTTARGGEVRLEGGNLVYRAPVDYYGPDSFTYWIVDSGVDVPTDGSAPVDNFKYDSAVVNLVVDPDNDAPLAQNIQRTIIEDSPVPLTITAGDLLVGSVGHANPMADPSLFSAADLDRFNEENQDSDSTVISLDIAGVTVDKAAIDNSLVTLPIATDNGQITAINFDASGNLIDFQYISNLDFNSDNPRTNGVRTRDTFGFVVQDSGVSLPDPALIPPPVFAVDPKTTANTVEILVLPQNDAPVLGDDIVWSGNPEWTAASNETIIENGSIIIPASFLLRNDQNTQNPRVVTDLGTAGQVDVRIDATQAGDAGRAVRIDVTQRTLADNAPPFVTVSGSVITVRLNRTPGSESTAEDLVNALHSNPDSSALVSAEIVGGDGTISIIQPAASNYSLNLVGGGDDELAGINDFATLTIDDITFSTDLNADVELLASGDLRYTPPAGVFGLDTFVYQASDLGFNENQAGNRQLASLAAMATVSVLIEPVNDPPVTFDRVLTGTEDTEITFTASDLIDGPPPALASNVNPPLPASFDESNQEISVVSFTVGSRIVDASGLPGGTGTITFQKDGVPRDVGREFGVYTFNFEDDIFVDGSYVPVPDRNELPPFDPFEIFDYSVRDDGFTEIPGIGLLNGTGSDIAPSQTGELSEPARVRLAFQADNDAPTFNLIDTIDILEQDNTIPVNRVIATSVLPGNPLSRDETQSQSVAFTYLPSQSTVPSGLFFRDPVVDQNGVVTVFLNEDEIGTAELAFEISDVDPLDSNFVPETVPLPLVTINVQPVNDPPVLALPTLPVTLDASELESSGLVHANISLDALDLSSGNPESFTYLFDSDDDFNANFGFTVTVQDTGSGPMVTSLELLESTDEDTHSLSNPTSCEVSANVPGMDVALNATSQTRAAIVSGTTNSIQLTMDIDDILACDVTLTAGDISFLDPTESQVDSDGTITYRIPEDNTIADGVPSTYRILLSAPNGSDVLGLLDVFSVGPANELDPNADGGAQELTVSAFPDSTTQGGTLMPVTNSNGLLVALDYTPPTDYNRDIGIEDSFVYTVIDDSTTGGETFSDQTRRLEDDQRTTDNTVRIELIPVNDSPEFSIGLTSLRIGEGAGPQAVAGFAFDVAAGPVDATDENSFTNGQEIQFEAVPVATSFDPAMLNTLFTTPPTISDDGLLTYEVAPDVFGSFEFAVTLSDDGVDNASRGDISVSDSQIFTINVRPINDPPVINPAAVGSLDFSTLEDTELLISADGSSVAGDLLGAFDPGPANESNQTLSLVNVPMMTVRGGTLTPVDDGNGTITHYEYDPPNNFFGQDIFSYQVIDNGQTEVAASLTPNDDFRLIDVDITITIDSVNDAPVFEGGADIVVPEHESGAPPIVIPDWVNNVFAGPMGAEDETVGPPPQTLSVSIAPVSTDTSIFQALPVAEITGSSISITFTPEAEASGFADFELTIMDSGPANASIGDENSIVHPFRIVITDDNDAPTFDIGPVVTVNEADVTGEEFTGPWATNILPGPPNESNQTVEFEVTVSDEDASLFEVAPVLSPTGELSFTPAVNANGNIQAQVVAVDSLLGRSAPQTLEIVITPEDDSPVANDDFIETDEDKLLRIEPSDVLANDSDPDQPFDANEILTLVPTAEFQSQLGATISFDNGDILYDPSTSESLRAMAPGEMLTDSFVYSITDPDGETVPPSATIFLTVDGLNDEPDTVDDSATITESGSININVLANDQDVDGTIDPASLIITLQPTNGNVKLEADGTVTYSARPGFSGADTFRYTVADNLGQQSEQATVTVSVNELPVAESMVAGGVVGDAQIIDVLGGDTSIDPSTIQIDVPPENGTVTINADGTLEYTPTTQILGEDSFQFSFEDSFGRRSSPGTVTLRFVASGRQNPIVHEDVTGDPDGEVTPFDVLSIINELSDRFVDPVNGIPIGPDERGPDFWDVNGSMSITPLDALLVINELFRRSRGISGNAEFVTTTGTDVTSNFVSDSIEIGTNLNRNGNSFEPEMAIEHNTDQVVAGSTLEASTDESVLNLIVEGAHAEEISEESTQAVDEVLSDLDLF